MSLLFHDAFHQMNIREDLDEVFRDVLVDGVTMSRRTGDLTVQITSHRLIGHRQITAMAQSLRRQMFGDSRHHVLFEEHYQLSEQYTLENLFPLYRTSIVDELAETNTMDARILKMVDTDIAGNTLIIHIEDNYVYREKMGMMSQYLEELFAKRFGMQVRVEIDYRQPVRKDEDEDELSFVMDGSPADAAGIPDPAQTGTAGASETAAKADQNKSGQAGAGANDKAAPKRKRREPDDPDIFYGRHVDGNLIDLSDIRDELGMVLVRGKIMRYEEKQLKSGKTLVLFDITDFTDSISGKIFAREDEIDVIREKMAVGNFIRVKGVALNDSYEKEITLSNIQGIKTIPGFTKERMDNSPEKRVELHLHTIMSDMDAVVNTKPLLKTLHKWGHKAVAITDHGVVQSFTDAYHELSKQKIQNDMKLIYGVEGYLVDDVTKIVRDDHGQKMGDTAVVFDIETTGFGPKRNKIIEIGAVKVRDGEILDRFSTFVNPEVPIPPEIEKLTSITDQMVIPAPTIDVILPQFLAFAEGCFLVAHNASFDVSFIRENIHRWNEKHSSETPLSDDFTVVDTVGMARTLLPGLHNYKLDTVAKEVAVSLEHHHRAVDDAECTAGIYNALAKIATEKYGADTLAALDENAKMSPEVIKRMPTYHVIILAKNELGRIHLYKLISESHLNYFARRPRIPKSLLMENREGLIIGSACEAGELFRAVRDHKESDEIARLASFYDYFEIQPIGNNKYMIADQKIPDVNNDEDLRDLNRQIVALGEEYGKPVVATCDVHFLEPEDEIYRRVIMNAKGFDDADDQPPLFLRTTEEMLAEFAYLGEKKAREVVITNTNLIADMIEKIEPVRPDKCPPVIEDSDGTLRRICYDRAHELYGEDLPPQVSERLEHELTSIISNGFAVMYIIAQKLVWKSNEDGYLVGSRGSVGSSFVAFMAGITEVNSLPAHYRCEKCHYVDFDSPEVRAYSGQSGCDMPDKVCPVCGAPLIKDGHDIPFETFLGFNGDKEPDIDLNFSGEYQSKAHAYTEVIFGEGQTFRAGTIGAVAEKTAYGYVLKYIEEHDMVMRKAEIGRIAAGCVGVRRTTGQHPGGIVVLPIGEDIYSFTPIQHPANDVNTPIITTHFDYHSIDHNLLKLDILGHDDPTMIRMLEDLTGMDAKTIQLDDEGVLSLFNGLEALGLTPDDLDGCDLGTLGVPEFGTKFVMQMLRDTRPKHFSELVRISGLSHGTDVWIDNAQKLINDGQCTLSTAICCRDDIMIYLIDMGLDPGHSFKIMESVRKGKGLTPEMEAEMTEHGVPDWYIWSCKKIKYMFPKAHAAAYVMMGFRVAWFKVYQPLAYYAAYFSIRATAFSYEKMCLGKERLEAEIAAIIAKGDQASAKEQDQLSDMRLVQEMYARGFDFVPIDLYRAKARHFQIVDGKLMPSFNSIEGMGDKAAYSLEEAAKGGQFLSKDDVKTRGKLSQTIVDKMGELGILGDLPESNQISLLDFMNFA